MALSSNSSMNLPGGSVVSPSQMPVGGTPERVAQFTQMVHTLEPDFVQLDEIYKCYICEEILYNRHSGPCGHGACFDCLQEIRYCTFMSQGVKCYQYICSENISTNGQVDSEIFLSDVYCPNRNRGCEAKMPWILIGDHYFKECPHSKIKCPYAMFGCTLFQKRKNINMHATVCKFQTSTCGHCGILRENKENIRRRCRHAD